MNATTEDRDEPIRAALPQTNAAMVSMPRCKRCNLLYVGNKSTSALRLTYCSFLCELGDLGFSMQGLEQMERAVKEAVALVETVDTEAEDAPSAALI